MFLCSCWTFVDCVEPFVRQAQFCADVVAEKFVE